MLVGVEVRPAAPQVVPHGEVEDQHVLRGRRALQVPARARAGAVSGGRWLAKRGRAGGAGRRLARERRKS